MVPGVYVQRGASGPAGNSSRDLIDYLFRCDRNRGYDENGKARNVMLVSKERKPGVPDNVDGYAHEHQSHDRRGDRLESPVSVGMGHIGWARREPHTQNYNDVGGQVGEGMKSVGNQGD